MLRKTLAAAAALAALLQPAQLPSALADEAKTVTVQPVFNQAVPNIPGKSLVSVLVTYAPGGASATTPATIASATRSTATRSACSSCARRAASSGKAPMLRAA